MKRPCSILSLLILASLASFAPASLLAQESPFVGTWKLNVAKSQFGGTAAPRSETRTVEAVGSGQKYTFDGIAADGSRIHYGFTTHFDGKAVPISGAGVPGGGDAVAITRLDPNTDRSIVTRGGHVVGDLRVVVSKDGKVTTQTRTVTNTKGQSITQVLIWERQ
jgi:hypothetical protein